MKCNNSYEKHRKKRNKNCLQPERVPGIINVRPDTSDTAQGPHSSRNWRQFYYKAIWRILQCLQKKKPRSCPPWQIRGFYAWRQRDSNPRPLRCERNALPAELCPLYPISIALNEKNASEIVNNYGFFPKIWEIRRALAGGAPSVKAQTYGQWPLPGRPRSSFRSGGSAPAGSPQASG